ncbi:MAG: nitroreductase family protein [Chloroflexi bacterium]|nr:nitroreductase family protein [Chloroflexota bacterium]
MEGRRSSRLFNQLPTERLSALLWWAARTRTGRREESGSVWQHRAAPSAGGRHPIDILVARITHQGRSLSLYDPIAHSLCDLDVTATQVTEFFAAVDAVLPMQEATLLWFVAQPGRTTSKYKYAESLIWRDSGALLAVVSLVAEALDLNSCAIGITGEPWISHTLMAQGLLYGTGGCLVGEKR